MLEDFITLQLEEAVHDAVKTVNDDYKQFPQPGQYPLTRKYYIKDYMKLWYIVNNTYNQEWDRKRKQQQRAQSKQHEELFGEPLKKFPRTHVKTVLKCLPPYEQYEQYVNPQGRGKTKWKDDEDYMYCWDRMQQWISVRNYRDTIEVLIERASDGGRNNIDIYAIVKECMKLVESGNNAEIMMEEM